MIRTPNVKVYPHEIKPGDEFFGYEKNHEDGGCTSHFCQVKVNDEGIPLVWVQILLLMNMITLLVV